MTQHNWSSGIWRKTSEKKKMHSADGASQDIYIGLLNLYLNKEILCMDYPIAIAGQGGRSIDAKAFIGTKSSEEQQKQIKEYREFLIMPEAATLSRAKMPITNRDKTLR